MHKIKKIHKIILFFILIFLLGIYSFSLYINNTIDHKNETIENSEINNSIKTDREATQIN
ncbi:hypothetical protein ACSTS3_17790 [Aquimarina muelleri]|uniref:Uncharacterized protein n=1 Tax=Aquimarina muelleri TaxID=279356 RepID=A0A918N4D7_9FLAO|nr:hypothetical protein GCM10007384_21440 [Aquimarina muelleri]